MRVRGGTFTIIIYILSFDGLSYVFCAGSADGTHAAHIAVINSSCFTLLVQTQNTESQSAPKGPRVKILK